jgi:hypothetical protein
MSQIGHESSKLGCCPTGLRVAALAYIRTKTEVMHVLCFTHVLRPTRVQHLIAANRGHHTSKKAMPSYPMSTVVIIDMAESLVHDILFPSFLVDNYRRIERQGSDAPLKFLVCVERRRLRGKRVENVLRQQTEIVDAGISIYSCTSKDNVHDSNPPRLQAINWRYISFVSCMPSSNCVTAFLQRAAPFLLKDDRHGGRQEIVRDLSLPTQQTK